MQESLREFVVGVGLASREREWKGGIAAHVPGGITLCQGHVPCVCRGPKVEGRAYDEDQRQRQGEPIAENDRHPRTPAHGPRPPTGGVWQNVHRFGDDRNLRSYCGVRVRCSVCTVPAAKHPLADRVLHLRSPDSGAVGQGVRYAIAGTTVGLWYLVTTTVLADVFGVAFQLALAIGFVTAVLLHFTLQRFFVWVHHEEFALPLHRQAGRYLVVAGVQYAITAAAISVLPSALDLPVTPVYYATAIALASVNFLIFRGGVFHAEH